jgi:hypothetical protein
MSEIQLTTRNASLADLAELLKDHRTRRLDVVANSAAITAQGGQLRVDGTVQDIGAEGVTSASGLYLPTKVADGGIADKLGIDTRYLRKLRDTGRLGLWDANVNGWLHGEPADADAAFAWLAEHPDEDPATSPVKDIPADGRSFMLRLLKADAEGTGIVRAFLSDKYFVIDNLDILISVLAGVRDSEADAQVTGCDLTDSKMYVRVDSPSVRALAPKLLENYRNPWTGQPIRNAWGGSIEEIRNLAEREGKAHDQGAEPVIFGGFVISNSELGGGAFSIKPRLTVEICGNSHTVDADAMRVVHLGGKQDEGVIEWSEETNRKALELVASKTKDAVRKFLTPEYVAAKVAEMEEVAGTPVKDAAATVHEVVAASVIPADLEADVLDYFIKGGQMTAGGVMQAVTATVQQVEDADLAAEMEGAALGVMAHAAKLA